MVILTCDISFLRVHQGYALNVLGLGSFARLNFELLLSCV